METLELHPKHSVRSVAECEHCGLPCDVNKIQENGHVFCCSGCAAVYQLLNENDMCAYYQEGKGITPESTDPGEFDFLNERETSDKFVLFAQGDAVQYRFLIPGMHCNSCIYLLERLERFNPGIISSRVDFFNKELLITVKNNAVKLSDLVVLLYHLGYKPDLTLSNDSGVKKKKISSRAIKIGIAGFAFGNIMMLSFPEYLGLSLDAGSLVLKRWFDFISLGLSLPVLFYCSTEFFESSYKAIRQKTLNIDLPIALAIVATFVRSLYEMFVNHQSGYFDSMTGIVFLLLTGRYFQDLTYHSLTFDRDYKSYFPLSARLIRDGISKMVNIKLLKAKDLIELRNGELLPADARLKSEFATVDYSFITGESKPVALRKDDKIYAGAKISGNTVQLELMASTDNSRLVKLWAVEKDKEDIDNSLTEKINYWFTLGLLVIGAFAFVYQYNLNGLEEAFKSLTSVLIVACPCILLLATTFANGHLLRSLKLNGMFVKNKNTLTLLNDCDTIVFDKTGTLTDNKRFTIENHTNLNSSELKSIGLLCHQSVHPYSHAIAKEYYDFNSGYLDAFTDVVGKGLQGKFGKRTIKVGSALFLNVPQPKDLKHGVMHVEIDGEYRGYFVLIHKIRTETNEITSALKSDGFDLYLSSGDNELNQDIMVEPFTQTLLQQTPENKVALIKQLRSQGKVVCMTGDGLNDAPALKEADIAISVADDVNAFFPACDVLLTAPALSKLPKLLRFVKAAKWVIIISFAFSLIYNVIGLYYAITAQLSPLTAAILMPSSSFTMLILTWVLTAIISRKVLRS
ncbi:MAG: heavy metal translocating P-type ATPase metal-binding domain-containing protein [Bacteroidetes bacterium]|nr:heavy metal translocating P-type ATPase metal-binding domain-containing protein [Bacteroidota bacterium]